MYITLMCFNFLILINLNVFDIGSEYLTVIIKLFLLLSVLKNTLLYNLLFILVY